MQIDIKLSKTKAEIFKQKDTFQLYKLVGLGKAVNFYPEYKKFMVNNSGKGIEEIEQTINPQIRKLLVLLVNS